MAVGESAGDLGRGGEQERRFLVDEDGGTAFAAEEAEAR